MKTAGPGKSGLKLTGLDEIGKRIREARRAKGITQAELGRMVKVQGATIQKYETGVIKDIPLSKLAGILEKLDIPDAVGVETEPISLDQFFADFGDRLHADIFSGRYLIVDLSEFPRESIEKITNTVSEAANKVMADRLTERNYENCRDGNKRIP